MAHRAKRPGLSLILLGLWVGCGDLSASTDAGDSSSDAAMRDGPRDVESDGGASDAGEPGDPGDAALRDAGETGPDAGEEEPDPGPLVFRGFRGNHSSPSIVRVGNKYHVYFAQQNRGGKHLNTPHAVFTEDGKIRFKGDALPTKGRFVKPGSPICWAPGVARIRRDRWMLYYTAHRKGTEKQKCLFRARSSTPHGPFVDDYAGPLHCQPRPQWSIDAYPLQGPGGTWHLSARIDKPGGINTISVRPLRSGGQHFKRGSRWRVLVRHSDSVTPWERPVIENAGVVHMRPRTGGDPRWFVFYSGGAWDDNSYAIGYADCGARLYDDRCMKRTKSGPWFATDRAVRRFGPGAPTFYRNVDGKMMMSIQAWEHSGGRTNSMNRGQIMRTYRFNMGRIYRPWVRLVRIDLQPR